MGAIRTYVCITNDTWWHNALWRVGHTVDYDKKPNDHFIPFNGDASLIEYALKHFDHTLNQNLSTMEKVQTIATLHERRRQKKREAQRIERRQAMRDRANRMDAFIEQGISA